MVQAAAIFVVLYGSEAAILRGLTATLGSTTAQLPVYAWDNHYPFWNEGFIPMLKEQFNLTIFDSGTNIGLCPALNILNEKVPTNYQILIEGDSVVDSYGWDAALLKVIEGRTVWATCHNHNSYREMQERGHYKDIINGYEVTVPLQPVMNSVCAHRTEWVNRFGGYAEENSYYGGSETKMWDRLQQHGNDRWVFVDEVKETAKCDLPLLDDGEYLNYKNAHARHRTFNGSFDEYLKR
jgi:hypothetical protein